MATRLYVLIRWPDGSRVINIENIKEPRKPFHMYAVGEQVLARCPGFTGLYWGILKGISEHKYVLEEKLQEDKEFQERLEEQTTMQHSGAPQSKRSRKSFPKWNPGNGLRKPQNDKTFRSIVEEAEASLQQSPATPSGRRESHPVSILVKSCPSEATSPQSSCLFQATSAFQTIYAAGISQRGATRPSQGSRDSATIATRRKSDDLVTQCQKHIFINREEKMEQLERMVLGLRQEVLSLKQKVQRLEAASFKEPELGCQPCEVPEHFNGYTKEQLKEAIRFDQKISTACKTLLYKLFTSDYIQSHSITGRRGNTFREAKPMMDERCIKVIRVLLKQRFGDHLSDTVITEKIQNVQKALRQKYKTECL
uniref:BEN domain-containing protein n=1 Tax=Pogona vitticeps TaxID=103695 RepID=A0ABM5G595_9SAUR